MLNRLKGTAAAVACLLLGPIACAGADSFTGKVAGVINGDTLNIAHGEEVVKVRLHGADCPELAQPFGPEAKQFSSDLALGNEVEAAFSGKDAKGRDFATVTLPDGKILNEEVVSAGMAWYTPKHTPRFAGLAGLNAKAIGSKKGLWADTAPLAPWDFRAAQEKKEEKEEAERALTEGTSEPEEDEPGFRGGEPVFVTKTGHEYHRPHCALLDKTRKVLTLHEAKKLGYTPCQRCRPPETDEEEKAIVISHKGDITDIPDVITPDLMAEIRRNPIYQQINPSWQKDANGQVIGLSADLSGTPYAPYAAMLGFQDNDILQSVNGMPITGEASVFDIVNRYSNGKTKNFKVGIVRDGRPQTVNVTIPF